MTCAHEELKRLVSLLPETDPTDRDYLTLLQSIECLGGLAETIDEILDAPTSCGSEPEAPAPKPAPAPIVDMASGIKSEDVRAALSEARGAGKNIRSVFEAVGANNFTAVKPEDYPKVMALIKELA